MKLPRFPRLSPASALALAALFFALGGGAAVAANHYLITSTKQIKPSVLKQLKGARGPAGPSATPAAALPGQKGETGAAGAQGPKGDTGDQGLPGLKGDPGATGAAGPTGPAGTEGAAEAYAPMPGYTDSASWTDLDIAGPSVTVTVPASGKVLVTLTAAIKQESTDHAYDYMGFGIDGALPETSNQSLMFSGKAGDSMLASATFLVTADPGSHTFTAKYTIGGDSVTGHGSATFSNRSIIVIPLP